MADHKTNEQARRYRPGPLAIVGLAALGLLVAAVVLLLVDPFNWRLLGLREVAAAAMPLETGLYAEIDLVDFDEETLSEFSQPFVVALAEPDVQDLAGGLENLDALLETEVGLTLRHDVMPWLGRSVGLGLTELKLLPDGRLESAEWLLVAGTQDRRGADEFLAKLSRKVTDLSGLEPALSEYRGRTITSFGPADDVPLGSLAFTRSAGQVIIGAKVASVQAAVDAQKGQSLAEAETFSTLSNALPRERGLTLFMDQARLPELSQLVGSAVPLAIGPLDVGSLGLPPGMIGVSIVDQGLRFDWTGPVTNEQSGGAPPGTRLMAGLFPASTVAFFTGDSLNDLWHSLKDSMEDGGDLADFEESMALFVREFDFDPEKDFLPALDGEWTLALLPADQGLLADRTDLSVGMVLLAEAADPVALAQAANELNEALAGQRLPLETVELGGVTATSVDLESLLGGPLPLYGVDDGYFFAGTDSEIISQVLAGSSELESDSRYAATLSLVPDTYRVDVYVDGPRLRAAFDQDQDSLLWRLSAPVKSIVFASAPAENMIGRGVAFIVVE